MPVAYGTRREGSIHIAGDREESYAEFDELVWRGDSYVFRVTATWPYKDYANGSDALFCHIDFMNVTQGTSGRFENVTIPGRNPREPDGHQRRHSAIRMLRMLINTQRPIASPVYP